MNPALIILGTAVITFPAGFILCAALTASKIADREQERANDAFFSGYDSGYKNGLRDDAHEMRGAHTRIADALEAKNHRILRALAQVTPSANATVKRMARILRGEA